MLLTSPGRTPRAGTRRRALTADLFLLAVLFAGVTVVSVLGGPLGPVEPLAGVATLTAAVVLALAGAVGADRRTLLVALALVPPAVGALLPPVAGGRDPIWQLLGHLTVLGVATLLAAAAAGAALGGARGRVAALTALGAVLVATAAVAVTGLLAPGWVPPSGVVLTVEALGRFGVAAAAGLLLVAGTAERHPLLRRVGLAVVVVLLAPLLDAPVRAACLFTAAALLLVAAAGQLRPGSRSVSGRHPARRRNRAAPADRPDSDRAAPYLADPCPADRDPDHRGPCDRALGGRLLGGRGLGGRGRDDRGRDDRGRDDRGPDDRRPTGGPDDRGPSGRGPGGGGGRASSEPAVRGRVFPDPLLAVPFVPDPAGERWQASDGTVAVGSVVDDLAVLYRTIGLDVRVAVHGDPWVGADRGGLSQLLANLLANCARHAPGAQVRVQAAARGPRVRIEVIDEGPGLPPGSTARLLRRGVRGPGSTGAGLGLAICSELVERYRGSFTVVSTPAGCTAVVELPTARRIVSAQAVSV